jgi:hypothetical protein
MGEYLLDTHTAIWFFDGNSTMSRSADRIIRDRTNPGHLFCQLGSGFRFLVVFSAYSYYTYMQL